jgi:hypothetical protein
LWSLTAGSLLKLLIEPGRASDNRSPIADTPLPVGALSIFDLGYFSLERFRRIGEAGAYWISRFQRGTTVFGPGGKRLDMPRFLQEYGQNGLADVSAVLGARTDDFLAG